MAGPEPRRRDPDLERLVHLGDLDALVREVDHRAARSDWEALLELRRRCSLAAVEVGKQLWGAAQYAAYRVALEAPAEPAASVVAPGEGRFTLGPLTEVLAQAHRFQEVAPHLDEVSAGVVAQERILRGEDLRHDPDARLDDTGLPGVLQPWEPDYVLPVYRPTERLDGSPPAVDGTPDRVVATAPAVSPEPGGAAGAPAGVEQALARLTDHWVVDSTGQAVVRVVTGDAVAAVATVNRGDVELHQVTVPHAMAAMAWAASTGGALGRRRGGAAGRAAAWWAGHAIADLPFPSDPDELEFRLEGCRWYVFGDDRPPTGWELRLVVEDPGAGWSAVVDAYDRRQDDQEPRTDA